ncbi:transcriptional regulator [Sinosporangium siamense]|uniref:Transcriptional regulator n=2 Tax=Sinosporangium siamense TaxID=1367973 RepID=A0A919RK95_9ACTN|nr:transcriptional regulator [Sinosporangium siamense]
MERLRSKIAIGVVGPHDLVEQIVHIGAGLPSAASLRLVGASQPCELEIPDRLSKILSTIDAVLFTGPLQHDLARQTGELPVPATHVPVSGAGLYACLLRGVLRHGIDPARISIDSLSQDEVAEAYDEIGVPASGVHVCEYLRPDSVRDFHGFHERLHKSGATGAAVTTVRSVADKLADDGVPVLRVKPTTDTVRQSLDTAALLGAGSRLGEAQIAIVLVELGASARPTYSGPGNYWQQELKLSLHRALLADVRLMGATVAPREENSYVVTTTVGALTHATEEFTVAPFMDRVRADVGVAVDVGIGLGHTARDADANALTALERARGSDAAAAFLVGDDGTSLSLPLRQRRKVEVETEPETESKAVKVRDRLLRHLGDDPEAMVVDAEIVAEILGVAQRSARRVLQNLVEEGLAWALPPVKSPHAGRPRQPYRLVNG